MATFLSLLGIVFAVALLKYRQQVGDTIGDADWMRYVGGVYNMVIIIGIFIFFWSLATLTGTTDLLLSPLKYILPMPEPPPAPGTF